MSKDIFLNEQNGIFPSVVGDNCYIFMIPFIAIFTGTFAYFNPKYFVLILILDLWLLGYHHVISTFTRIGFDKTSVLENWQLLFPLPLFVFLAVYFGYQLGGGILIGSIYLYWQWYHYSRQSEGVAKTYGMKAGSKEFINNNLNRALFYLVPLTSFVYMISSGQEQFLDIPIATVQCKAEIRYLLLFICYASVCVWLVAGMRALFKKTISTLYFGYVVSHFLIYIVSYIAIDEINYSWLTINIWHNAQYIGFVWLYNRKRHALGIEPLHQVVSYISQPGRFAIYIGVCLVLSTLIYQALQWVILALDNASEMDLALTGLVYFAINFHHYIVDSKIWKLRKPEVQENLLSSTS